MTLKELEEYAKLTETSILTFSEPNYEDALIGITIDNRAVYDYDKMIKCLMESDGMEAEEAVDFINYNTVRSLPYYANAPVILMYTGEENE